mmetsp:Transcript_30800/g.34069  ORF Transcript_30800/g.34069 Transcript_30800/m.34069 type:complete len:299 (+) Transcript_30800:137-1033(+)|eukprot:CAMPEP_0194147436 /NCGR_PEP_ID=MMETSP0152-20130528/24735_1 /TAXON_ID=1049557 /ORGANISM="Thalassiothrix antarctica, Strain L6-D1" /LENGTH=298 /DNA_ID=CAMNT_0038848277 /DNA_START=11 /DNA_END=907 /DNA_ORIENTATION=-
MMFKSIIFFIGLQHAVGFQTFSSSSCHHYDGRSTTTTSLKARKDDSYSSRRDFLTSSILLGSSATLLLPPQIANAGIDPSLLKGLAIDGDDGGNVRRLKSIQNVIKPESDLINQEYEKLPSGVQYREYREGKGNEVVQAGSKVFVEMSIRCQSFATANEPGGVKYFTTKDDTDFNELGWTLGTGAFPKGLEEGMMGMHRNGLRRIELPSMMVFSARDANQLPLPQTKSGKRMYEQLFKTDATLLFEVLVTRIKNVETTPSKIIETEKQQLKEDIGMDDTEQPKKKEQEVAAVVSSEVN